MLSKVGSAFAHGGTEGRGAAVVLGAEQGSRTSFFFFFPPLAAMAEEVSKFVKGVLQKSAHGDAVVQTKVLDRVRMSPQDQLTDASRPYCWMPCGQTIR